MLILFFYFLEAFCSCYTCVLNALYNNSKNFIYSCLNFKSKES